MEKYCTSRQATDDNIIRCTRIACWILKATETHSEYVILIVFSLQQWLHESASMLRYMYITCIVLCLFCMFPAYCPFVICVCILWLFCYGSLDCSISTLINKNSIQLLLLSASTIPRPYSGIHWTHNNTYRKNENMKTLMLIRLNIETNNTTCSL